MPLRKCVLLLLPSLCAQAAVPKELQALADQARALPPDFAADVLLKLASSALANDTKWKRALIEDAFLSAALAPQPYRLQGPVRAAPVAALSRRLERLTLQTGAVDAMLVLDAQRARVMFEDIAAPDLPKVSCESSVSPELSSYYKTAASLFTAAFTPEQRRKQLDIVFLRSRLSAIRSPSQVVPALKMLDQVDLTPRIRNELMATFAGILERLNGGDREFAASEPLLVSSAVPEMHETPVFLPALRNYIVRQLSGPRCGDQVTATLPESAAQFNKLISRIDPGQTQYYPITEKEVAPLRDDGSFKPSAVGQSAHAKQTFAEFSALRHSQRDSPEWTAHYFESLNLLERWKAGDEASEEEFFLLVAVHYQELVDLSPSDAAQRTAFGAFQHFLEQQYPVMENHALWFVEFGQLASPSSISDKQWVLDEMLHSTNSVIAVYAQLRKLTGTS